MTVKDWQSLRQYEGEDKIVSSHELKLKLAQEKSENFTQVKSQIPSLDRYIEDFRDGELIVISGPTKNGKCMKKGTRLLMFNGSIMNIEDIAPGDLLMGDDSRPRRVLSTCSGKDEMFKIIPWQGDSYTVNGEHILCLQRVPTTHRKKDGLANSIKEISVNDYLKLSKTQKHILKTYRVPVSFPEKKVPYDPYVLGLWLGDGHTNSPEFTTADKEVWDYLWDFAKENNFDISVKIQEGNKSKILRLCGKVRGKNRFIDFLKEYNLLGNKHIPHIYKCNSERNRLKLLAGLIDTDGNFVKSTRGGALEFVSKRKTLIDDVAYLCRSLGFSCTPHKTTKTIKSIGFEGEYWVMRIGGDTSRIPCLLKRKNRNGMKPFKNVLRSSFKVEAVGRGEYYGFTLDGNGRYVLADFQVTHNTLLAETLTVNFTNQNHFALWFTFEVPPRQFLSHFSPALPLIFMPSKLKAHAMDWLESRILESFLKYQTRIIFIDHLHYIFDMARSKNTSLDIGVVIRKLKTIAVENNFVIILLCHTTKGKSETELSYESIRDSSIIAQESDAVMMVKRKPELGDTRARVRLEFHRRTGWMEKDIELIKVNGYLRECTPEILERESEERDYRASRIKGLN